LLSPPEEQIIKSKNEKKSLPFPKKGGKKREKMKIKAK
jgi:hypothetical protein